ncbi:MAG: hypothetical protein COU25_00090 [Candidatus Levybacteria bacterium CG10_big_fil_rev_8_21_14_0_10_35_13]|nr:MAG: hypothetical protein COU25_00090 [Candidatus Levybacteria bacterium CG10_big_fil_rev_8_21_14_0_10_35_13]
MNTKIERCQQCPIQCELQTTAETIIVRGKKGQLDERGIGLQVSSASQWASRNECPGSEIKRTRSLIKETLDQLGRRIWNSDIAVSPPRSSTVYEFSVMDPRRRPPDRRL